MSQTLMNTVFHSNIFPLLSSFFTGQTAFRGDLQDPKWMASTFSWLQISSHPRMANPSSSFQGMKHGTMLNTATTELPKEKQYLSFTHREHTMIIYHYYALSNHGLSLCRPYNVQSQVHNIVINL